MRPVRVTVASQAASAPIPLDHFQGPFNVGIGVVVAAGSTLTYSVQHTFDDPAVGFSTWFSHPTVASQAANADGNYAFPVTGIKVLVNSGSGTATLKLIQAGI